ncbi:hypothetical protein [Burkholderia gladioli]|uniref:hypothetical protein n=1 Tax=Burkholderia gladioli TaxID=28095 RepID=UPI001640B2B1|nr:hypothetical protein [Burkholderia gladioli]
MTTTNQTVRAMLPAEFQARLDAGVCISCGQPFSAANVFTEAGAREVRISQTCERCFDALFEGQDD